MKLLVEIFISRLCRSPSPRRAWIEINLEDYDYSVWQSRPPHGGRGLKSPSRKRTGIKSPPSPSPRRAWIEILLLRLARSSDLWSPSPRRAWIEIKLTPVRNYHNICRPPHGGRGLKFALCHALPQSPRRPPHGGRGLKSENLFIDMLNTYRRPPHGGRGLKLFPRDSRYRAARCRPPHGGRGLKF